MGRERSIVFASLEFEVADSFEGFGETRKPARVVWVGFQNAPPEHDAFFIGCDRALVISSLKFHVAELS